MKEIHIDVIACQTDWVTWSKYNMALFGYYIFGQLAVKVIYLYTVSVR